MNVILWGANGAMGRLLAARLGGQVTGRVSIDGEDGAARTFAELPDPRADVILDFSHHTAVAGVLEAAKALHCAVVIGATGHTQAEKERIFAAAREVPVFYAGNMSLGIAVLCRLARLAAAYFPDADIEIVETHHNRKADAPSGTAHMLFQAIQAVRPEAREHCGRTGDGRREKNEIGISSLRMGAVVGIHEVHICTPSQTLTLRHEAHDRGMFADGAIEAARFVMGKAPGLYGMDGLLEV